MSLLPTESTAVITGADHQTPQESSMLSHPVTIDFENPLSPYPYLTLRKLRNELKKRSAFMTEEMKRLLTQVCDCSDEIWHEPTYGHEFRARLRYRVPDANTGVLKLAREWVRILRLCKDYMKFVPPDVQAEFAFIKQTGNLRSVGKSVSLVAFIKKRNDEARDQWNASVAERNARCGWDLNTDIATDDCVKPNVQPKVNKHPIKNSDGSELTPMTVSSTVKRVHKVIDHSASDEKDLPRKRTGSTHHTSAPNATGVQVPAVQGVQKATAQGLQVSSAQQTLGHHPPLLQSNTRSTTATHHTPTTMPIGARLGLRPEKGSSSFPYEWSYGRKRAHLGLNGSAQLLPDVATSKNFNKFSSKCTYEHADIRLLGDVQITAVELISVSSHLGKHSRRKLILHQYFPQHIKWRAVFRRLTSAGWTASSIREYIVGFSCS
jgi:hypothetical protein